MTITNQCPMARVSVQVPFIRVIHAPNSLLAGKIQGILPISPVGCSQIVQNVSTITLTYEKIFGALEPGDFGSHQGSNWEISHPKSGSWGLR